MALFLGVPGALELVVVVLVLVVLFGVPLAVVALGVLVLRGSRGDGDVEEEVAALREEVAELRAAVRDDADGARAGTDDEPPEG